MTISPDLNTIARQVKQAQDLGQRLEPFTSQYPGFDLHAAYTVAQLVHAARMAEGAQPLGRKIGFSNPAMWARYGVAEPVWAHLYDTTVVHLPSPQAVCGLHGLVDPKIEPEIVLHFHSAPPLGGDLAAILACVDWVAHGFEIVQCHYPDWKFQAADTVADWGLHASLLIGPPQTLDQLGPDLLATLASFSIALSCDGQVREVGEGRNVFGSPLAAVAYLSEVLAKQTQARPLQANELVTTGTLAGAYSVRVGETWCTELQGIALPGLSVTFTD